MPGEELLPSGGGGAVCDPGSTGFIWIGVVLAATRNSVTQER